ncbi:MAG: DEAD/DEAH box helicase family protein [Lachnospiraceae bacterium]|nr:DEAD/DEAH box helicase family protein [Lachnospiraceae bacterium]
MDRPDFKEIGRMISEIRKAETAYELIFSGTEKLEEEVKNACLVMLKASAAESLKEIPVSELKSSKAGIRTALLEDAGYHTLFDVYNADDHAIRGISGIGEKQAEAIRTVTDGFLMTLAGRGTIVLDPESSDPAALDLLVKTAKYRQAGMIRRDAGSFREQIHQLADDRIFAVKIRNSFRWFFSSAAKKEETALAAEDLAALFQDPLFLRMQNLLTAFAAVLKTDQSEALRDYEKNSAAYYALFEKYSGAGAAEELVYSSVPAQLAAEINAEEFSADPFNGTLRTYQEFGAKYILHQKRVLLGDEMGLGKTIQAIAAMAHIASQAPGSHFLVVCPASVMINWCREIKKFSSIMSYLVHGPEWESLFQGWKENGGAAVTSFEGMAKIARRINNVMKLALFVIDEAHYIKNPEAQRTKNIHMLEDESERILLMTGTPLENRVDEMCELIGFVRPDLKEEVRTNAGLRNVPEFRQMLALVYLRRLREDVLKELPPMTEQEEWCAMTEADTAAYLTEVSAGNFMGMRRVSFLQEDLSGSGKARRLSELCDMICEEGRKAVVYSYFRETVRKVSGLLAAHSAGVITGSTPAAERQQIIDRFSDAEGGCVLVCQIQAGGTGLNIQAASAVIFCEPQIKPSLTKQALSRVYRMGQVRNVLVCHLLSLDSVDEEVMNILKEKQGEFDLFADESVIADAADSLADSEWIRKVVEQEKQKYLPAVIVPSGVRQ